MNIVHLVVVKNSFYILESGRTIQKSAHFSLILGTKNLVKVGTQQSKTKLFTRKPLWRLVSSRIGYEEAQRSANPAEGIEAGEAKKSANPSNKDIDPSEGVDQPTK